MQNGMLKFKIYLSASQEENPDFAILITPQDEFSAIL
jgi:hypothetical protein